MSNELITKPVQICSINFVNENGQPLDIDIADYFLRLESSFESKKLPPLVMLHGRQTSAFRYKHNDFNGNKIFIIPLGHPKNGVVYKRNTNDILNISEISGDLFNINLLYYNGNYNIAILTSFKEAPNISKINEYFNSYIKNPNIRFKILPLIKIADIDTIASSQEVKSISLTLDLGLDINKYFNPPNDNSQSMIQDLLSLMHNAADYNSNEIVLTLNVGDRKHGSSMYKEKICELLHLLDIDNNDCIKQIQVNYRHGKSDKIEKAYLKNKDIILRDNVQCLRSFTGLDDKLLNQADGIIEKNISEIYNYQEIRKKNIIKTNEQIILQNPPESEVIESEHTIRPIIHT